MIDEIDYDGEYAELDVKNIGETDMAVHFDDGDNRFWAPKSVMQDWPEEEDTGTAIIQMWFAIEEDLV